MSTGLRFDNKVAERLIAVYVTPDVVAQRQQIVEALHLQPGERVLDVGSGPGFLASTIADRVGASGQVCGVDISESLLALAAPHCAHQSWVDFRYGDATKLPFPDGLFDVAVVTQVLEYVANVHTALTELHRVLRSGGRALILDTDWDSIVWHATNRERANRILKAWDEHLADPYLPRTLASKLRQAGFQVETPQIIPLFNPVFDTETYSNRIIDIIVPFVSGRQGITAEEAEAWAHELRQLGKLGSYFFSINRYLFIARRSTSL
jgi:ubiquinone/menaquinone biosynthesis C-methylase UbiE